MKKGFTLIELLAVVIILGVVAVIVSSQVIRIVDRSKEKAFKESVLSVIRESKNEFTLNQIESGSFNIGNLNLKIKNIESFTGGKIGIDSKGVVFVENLTDNTFCANGKKENLTIIKGAC